MDQRQSAGTPLSPMIPANVGFILNGSVYECLPPSGFRPTIVDNGFPAGFPNGDLASLYAFYVLS
jgi:hypothetical protein